MTALLLLVAVAARAYDFAETVPSGQTLYFSVVGGGVEVVYPANVVQPTMGWNGYQKPVGSLTIPSTVTHDGVTYNVLAVSNHAFYACNGLTQVTVQQGIRALRSNAFGSCTGIATVSLPASLDTLAAASFANCSTMTSLVMHSDMPPYCPGSPFANVNLAEISLTVPCHALSNYNAVAPWNTFGTIDEGACSVTLSVSANYAIRGSVSGGGTYPEGTVVVMTATADSGYFFAFWNDGDTVNPRTVQLQHETSFMAYFFAVMYDTVFAETVHDTVEVHDTVRMVVVHVDTVYNTTIDTVLIEVLDTVEVHDTLWYTVIEYDTVEVHDTTIVYIDGTDTIFLYDTVRIAIVEFDTLRFYDTTVVHDTLLPTFFRLTVDGGSCGVGIGNGILPAGTEAEFGVLPLEGYAFSRWNDGNTENPRRVTLTSDIVYTAAMTPLGATAAGLPEWSMCHDGRMLTVGCEPGHTLRIYTAEGRLLLSRTTAAQHTCVRLPAVGVYLVQVGDGPARKVVIEH